MNASRPAPARSLQVFVWATAAATLLLICSGGMVTSKGVGLAVPDWPTTFGYNMFLFPVSQWVGGILFEHTHRLIASTIGFLTIVLAIWLWRAESRRWLRILGVVALAAVILQGVLGGLRVTMLKDEIGIFHACLAQAFLALLVFIGVAASPSWSNMKGRLPSALVWLPIAITLAIYLQLALGATMRHQHRDLSILDFPMAYGKVLPDVSPARLNEINQWREARALSEVTAGQIWLQMAHRAVAIVILGGVVGYWLALRRRRDTGNSQLRFLSDLWVLFLGIQIALGAWTVWSNKAADIATAHVAVGATMLSLGMAICAVALRLRARHQIVSDLSKQSLAREEVHA